MSQYFKIHPENPQGRHVRHAAQMIRDGSVVVYPTDSGYALGCHLGDKKALERICRIKQLDGKHNFTLICRDLSEVSLYARFDTPVYRLLKAHTPGSYTFILRATKEVPRRLMHPKRKTIGLRVPDHKIALAILEELGEPMMTTTMVPPGENYPLNDPPEIRSRYQKEVDLVIDGGCCGLEPTTMINLLDDVPVVIRKGKGDPAPFE